MLSIKEVIKSTTIMFHSKEEGYNIYNDNKKFGVLTIEAEDMPVTESDKEIHSANDISGSMSDKCNDGRTKMQHANLTLENIVSLLSSYSDKTNITLGITAFDDKLETILEQTKINSDQEQVRLIHEKINKMRPRGQTDIGIALKDAKNKLQASSRTVDEKTKKSFLLMTDGEITKGIINKEQLNNLLPTESDNYFIGFGKDHDYGLLQGFAKQNMGAYFYVDKIENAGLVFGEIIHSILYSVFNNGMITVTNGEIYDFINNQWVTEMNMPKICSESKKHFHVRSETPDEFRIVMQGITPYGMQTYEDTTLPELEDPTTGLPEQTDLRKYMYRQKTLELLAEAVIISNNFIETIEKKKKKEFQTVLRNFRKEVESYKKECQESQYETQDMQDYLKQLCDDLYICEKTLLSRNALLYTVTRQNAQARETSYNMTQIDDYDIMPIQRQNAFNFQDNDGYNDEEDEEDDAYEISACPVNRTSSSHGQQEVMRACSNKVDTNYYEQESQSQNEFNSLNIIESLPKPVLTRLTNFPDYQDCNNNDESSQEFGRCMNIVPIEFQQIEAEAKAQAKIDAELDERDYYDAIQQFINDDDGQKDPKIKIRPSYLRRY
jgi:uncharacterized protein YegL